MKIQVSDIETILDCEVLNSIFDKEIKDVFVCDLLSWIMGHSKPKSCLVTILGHMNVLAVATLMDISCIIIAHGATVEKEIIQKAEEEGITVFSSPLTSYEIAKALSGCEEG